MHDSKLIDLSIARPVGTQIIPLNRRIGAISVTFMTAGATFNMTVGNTQPVPIDSACNFFGFNPDREGSLGLFIDNAAQPGAIAKILVGYVDDDRFPPPQSFTAPK